MIHFQIFLSIPRFFLLGICTKVADPLFDLLEGTSLDFITGGAFVFVCTGSSLLDDDDDEAGEDDTMEAIRFAHASAQS